jgi:hypothetical protein
MINLIPLPMAEAEINKETLMHHLDKETEEGRQLPE